VSNTSHRYIKCRTFKVTKNVVLCICPEDPSIMIDRRTRDLIFLSKDLGKAIALLSEGSISSDLIKLLNLSGNELQALINALRYLVERGWVGQTILSKLST